MHRFPAVLFLFGLAAPAGAQNVVLDEGEFHVTQAEGGVGTETFAIRRLGQGVDAYVIANAVIELDLPAGHEQVKPLLQTGPDLSFSRYQVEVAGADPVEIAVTSGDRRLLARTRSSRGEQEREFRAATGTVLLEHGVAHLYWFLSRMSEGDATTVLVPRTGAQGRIVLISVRPEPVGVAGAQHQARHVTFEMNGALHEVWYDSEDRVLRVEVPESGFLAERTIR